MATVIIIEPCALLRMGIVQHLSEALPNTQFQGADYPPPTPEATPECRADAVLLSVAAHEDMHRRVDAVRRAYASPSVLLSSDSETVPAEWGTLPSSVAGYVPRNASPALLAASISLVLAGGKCFSSLAASPAQPLAATASMAGSHNRRTGARTESSTIPASPSRATEKRMLSLAGEPLPRAYVAASLSRTEAEMLRITPRQYEVLVLLARGYPIKMVSRQLNISVATAKAHTETLYQRLDAHNRNQAVYAAVSRGATLGWNRLEPYGVTSKRHSIASVHA